MNYSIDQIKSAVIRNAPLCGIAWGRETNRERKATLTLPSGWGCAVVDTRGCGNRGLYHPIPRSGEARAQYLGWRLTALTGAGLTTQEALRCHDMAHGLRWGKELEAEAVQLALKAPGCVWDPDAMATGRRREEFLDRWDGASRHPTRVAGDGGISHGRQYTLIEIARAILLAP